MADIRTHLRELSVAVTVGLLKNGIDFSLKDLYDSNTFYNYANKVIDNGIYSANNILSVNTYSGELKSIIDNGYKLGKKVFNSNEFDIKPNDSILWLGNDTQKGDPIDLSIGKYLFSLKEESFILKNMGLYQLLNNLTGSHYARGLHVFSAFAPTEYDAWFKYTWELFVEYLTANKKWTFTKNADRSEAYIENNNVVLAFNGNISIVKKNIKTNAEYMAATTSLTREKVFSKWINNFANNNCGYMHLKRVCSETAGANLSKKIMNEFKPINVYEFFQIYPFDYYYAKTTSLETTILKVPSRTNFNSAIKFVGCKYEVPASQLNVITTFKNTKTNKTLEFRNECRFSHGQFNGTPEAKMYVVRNTALTDLYEPIK